MVLEWALVTVVALNSAKFASPIVMALFVLVRLWRRDWRAWIAAALVVLGLAQRHDEGRHRHERVVVGSVKNGGLEPGEAAAGRIRGVRLDQIREVYDSDPVCRRVMRGQRSIELRRSQVSGRANGVHSCPLQARMPSAGDAP